MNTERYQYLLDHYRQGTLTDEERNELHQALETDIPELIGTLTAQLDAMGEPVAAQVDRTGEETFRRVVGVDRLAAHAIRPRRSNNVLRWTAAAIFVVAATAIIWLVLPKHDQQHASNATGITAGHAGATLKLSDGRTILIDTAADGLLANDGSVSVFKENGQIVYKGNTSDRQAYHEIVTRKGRQWSARLPDGSVVWLNAASSIRYPLRFADSERLVTMTGEAIFRVTHNKKQPFRVKAGPIVVEDIGTEFNINAYTDEPAIVTTLVEGKAKVITNNKTVMVTADKDARYDGRTLEIRNADAGQAVAWRKGSFRFVHAGIPEVMRSLSRWYDVEVEYRGEIPDETFSGEIGRDLSLDQALKVVEQMSAHVRVESNRKVVVTP